MKYAVRYVHYIILSRKREALEEPASIFVPSEMNKAQKRTDPRHFSESEGNCDV